MRFFDRLHKWQPLTAGLIAAIIAGSAAALAWTAASKQIRFTELSIARRDEESALRELQTLQSAIQYFGDRRTELAAVEEAKKIGTEQKPWWQVYMGMYERSLLAVDHRASAAPGHPALDLERAAYALQSRMEMFADKYYRRLGHLRVGSTTDINSDPLQDLAQAYGQLSGGQAEITQLESDMPKLRAAFLNALDFVVRVFAHLTTFDADDLTDRMADHSPETHGLVDALIDDADGPGLPTFRRLHL